MSLIADYIISLTNLYGIVHTDKVVEIYNMQNEEKVDRAILTKDAENNIAEIKKNFAEPYDDYFVHETIIEFDEFDLEMAKKHGKPFYIPPQKELLKYKDDLYFERTPEYKALLKYVEKNFYKNDKDNAEMLCEDVYDECQLGNSVSDMFEPFNRRKIEFEGQSQLNEVMNLLMELSNNVRLWQNNGFTPNELHHAAGRSEMNNKSEQTPTPEKAVKVGRNDPCPCGSGKKYKKCCLNKV